MKDGHFFISQTVISSDRVRPHIYNINIFKGKINWESEFNSSFNVTKSSGVLIFGNKYDVSGFYPPVFIDDEIYFFYDGLRKFSTKQENNYGIPHTQLIKTKPL